MASKGSTSQPTYELIYWPGMPGRGEFIRLPLEATSTPYTDVAFEAGSAEPVVKLLSEHASVDADGNRPVFAPPALRVHKGDKPLLIHQTPNILIYLAEQIGLEGKGDEKYWVRQLALTALDLNNEAHDTHHPVAVGEYYEDQKEESLRRATDFRKNRIPKFFKHYESALEGNKEKGKGVYLVGDSLTYADTTFWQVVDGLKFAFPKEMQARSKEFPLIYDSFYPKIKEQLKDYLNSNRRQEYSNGVYRHYPELDRQ